MPTPADDRIPGYNTTWWFDFVVIAGLCLLTAFGFFGPPLLRHILGD